jgi:hypothetical protein
MRFMRPFAARFTSIAHARVLRYAPVLGTGTPNVAIYNGNKYRQSLRPPFSQHPAMKAANWIVTDFRRSRGAAVHGRASKQLRGNRQETK